MTAPALVTRRVLSPLWSAAAAVGILTTTGKIVGLAKEMLIADRFGAGPSIDAVLLALALPTFVVNVVAGMLPMALTPAYIGAREHGGLDAARKLAGTALVATYKLLAVVAVGVAMVSAWGGGALSGSGLAPETRAILPALSLAFIPFTLLQGVSAAWTGLLAAERAYLVGAAAPMLLPVVLGLSVWFGADALGVWSIAGGLVAGSVLQALLLVCAMRQRGIPLVGRGARLTEVYAQYVPAIGSAILSSGTGLVDQGMAAWLPAGSIAALGYGSKLVSVGMAVGIIAIGTPILPVLSGYAERASWRELTAMMRQASLVVLSVSLPIALMLAAASTPIVRLAFERGAFTPVDTALVAKVQAVYLLQLPAHCLAVLYARVIAAMRVTRYLTIGAALSLLVNVLGNLALMGPLGVTGIALSTTLVHIVSAAFLYFTAKRLLQQRVDGAGAAS
ncbi:MAG: murein biosynthesis integral membrane protein MurJ [Gemmatimonadaceae bacterium]